MLRDDQPEVFTGRLLNWVAAFGSQSNNVERLLRKVWVTFIRCRIENVPQFADKKPGEHVNHLGQDWVVAYNDGKEIMFFN
jgi:hypothetical protein